MLVGGCMLVGCGMVCCLVGFGNLALVMVSYGSFFAVVL